MEILINNNKIDVDIADTFFKRLIGLMGKKNIQKGLLFKKNSSIHTFFMRENIDVLMLDKEKKILLVKKNLKKNKILIKKKAYYTIELPINTIPNTDNLEIKF